MTPSPWDRVYVLNAPGLNLHSELLVRDSSPREVAPRLHLSCAKGPPWVLKQWGCGWGISSSEQWHYHHSHRGEVGNIVPSAWHSLLSLAWPMNILEQSGAIKIHCYHYCSCYVIMVYDSYVKKDENLFSFLKSAQRCYFTYQYSWKDILLFWAVSS